MYQIVTERSEQPVVSIIEMELFALYNPDHQLSKSMVNRSANDLSLLPARLFQRTTQACRADQLRHFITSKEDGYYFDLRFSVDEFSFMSALSSWLQRVPSQDLHEFPDLTELVVRQFREGTSLSCLPVSALKAYATRWDVSLWATVQMYKVLSRDLHQGYQGALKQWYSESYEMEA